MALGVGCSARPDSVMISQNEENRTSWYHSVLREEDETVNILKVRDKTKEGKRD